MIIGATVLALVLAAAFLHSQGASWEMVFSWFRGAAAAATTAGRDEVGKQQQQQRRGGDENARQQNDVVRSDEKSNGSARSNGDTKGAEKDEAEDAGEEEASTPKAAPQRILPPVPTFALEAPSIIPPAAPSAADFESDPSSEDDEDSLPSPQFPAINSAQRASGTSYTSSRPAPAPGSMPPPPSTLAPRSTLFTTSKSSSSSSSSNLMAPPPRPSGGMPARTPPTLARAIPSLAPPPSGLRAPTASSNSNGPLPNRGPSGGSARSSLSAPQSTNVATPNPRKKVQLTPGHSPLDWAHLQRSGTNLAGVSGLQRVTPSMLKHHNGRKGRAAWSSYRGKVYNLSPYLPFHPGGEGELRRAAGKDGEKLFVEVHPWVNWDNMLEGCVVGILVSESDPRAGLGSEMDEMD